MKILLIHPNMGLERIMNHGIVSLSAAIKSKGYDCKAIQIQNYFPSKLLKMIRRIYPDIIGISLTENYRTQMEDLGKLLKAQLGIKIFVGGPFPSAYPEWINDCEWMDGLCIGEGERSFTEVIAKISRNQDYTDTLGFWFRDKERIIKNDYYPLDIDLDKLPLPDIEIFDKETILNYPAFSFSRGCPFNCTYCCAPLYRKRFGNKIRFKSPERAIQEIKQMIRYCDPKILYFDDDTFLKSREWLVKFLKLYKVEINRHFSCNSRPETINEELIVMLRDAKCSSIGIGLESGDEEIRIRMLNRHISNEKIIEAFEICRKFGINTFTFNMVGIPGETKETFENTLKLNKLIKPSMTQISIFYPYRGTVLGELAYEQGLVVKKDGYVSYFGHGIISLPEFPLREIETAALWFRYNVFKGYDYKKSCYLFCIDWLTQYPEVFRFVKSLVRKLIKS